MGRRGTYRGTSAGPKFARPTFNVILTNEGRFFSLGAGGGGSLASGTRRNAFRSGHGYPTDTAESWPKANPPGALSMESEEIIICDGRLTWVGLRAGREPRNGVVCLA